MGVVGDLNAASILPPDALKRLRALLHFNMMQLRERNFPSGSAGLDLQKGNLRPALGCVYAKPFKVVDPRNIGPVGPEGAAPCGHKRSAGYLKG